MQALARPSFLRRAVGATALYVVGIPMIVIGMLLMLTLVAVDKVERRFRKPSASLKHHHTPPSRRGWWGLVLARLAGRAPRKWNFSALIELPKRHREGS